MKLLFVLCVLSASVASCFSLDREAFTFTDYQLDVRIEPEQQRLAVRGTITLRNDSSRAQKNAALQISSGLTWRSIQAEGKPLQFVRQLYVSDIDHTGELSEAIVALPKEVPLGGTVKLAIGYEGVIVLDATRLTRIGMPKENAIHSDWDQISKSFSAVRGVGYVAWYPVAMEAGNLSEGRSLFEVLGRWKQREQKAEMEIRLSHSRDGENAPPALLCTAAGTHLVEEISRAQEAVTDCQFAPLGLRVPAFVVANYEILERPVVEIARRPEHKSNAEKFAQAAEAVAPFVTEWFGAPREKAQVVELLDPGASPFESGAMLLTPLNDTDPKLLEIALVHELTHAAFSSPRPWIYEGLAHFAQGAYRERQASRQAALDFMGLHRSAIVDAEKTIAAEAKDAPTGDESLVTTTIDEFYRSKAAYVWWMLRDLLSEETLRKVLAAYQADQDKDPAYLQRLAQAQSGRDLQWFFDDWVYHDRGLPDFRVESAYPRQASQGNYLVTVTIENLAATGAEVPVTVRFDGGETTQRVQVRGRAKGIVRIATPRPPTEITVNDGSVPESDLSNNVFRVGAPAN
ncbi:MAG TPA: hypothetical protein VE083_11240 [Terriglobales bacterium]|nr:hypothetical protein [Terriglobales bacterium]